MQLCCMKRSKALSESSVGILNRNSFVSWFTFAKCSTMAGLWDLSATKSKVDSGNT